MALSKVRRRDKHSKAKHAADAKKGSPYDRAFKKKGC